MDKNTIKRINSILPKLDERLKRQYLAAEAEALGKGGIKEISRLTGMHRNTISSGLKELRSESSSSSEDPSKAFAPKIRRKGGGRKSILETQPGIEDALEKLVEGDSFSNPESPLRWTTKSLRRLADELGREGFRTSHTTVRLLLEKMGFSLQVNPKMKQDGKESQDRDAQFRHINDTALEYTKTGQPVISIDCKKNIGNFKNSGAEYAPKKQSVEVLDRDFPLPENGKAVSYGIYDRLHKEGYVNVGVSKDTAQFAVHSIRAWWLEMGKERFPDAAKLYITVDGGSNGSCSRLWETELQEFADEIHIPIEVSHFPPGTSKWNKIEHRMFSQISKDWRDRPLETFAVIVSLIASAPTEAGIKCGIDPTLYESGSKVTGGELEQVNIVKNSFHEEWNYTILPH